MKSLFSLLFFSQIYPFFISYILFSIRKIDTYKFYYLVCDNFDDIKLKNAPFKTLDEYRFFMADYFCFKESENTGLGIIISFNIICGFTLLLLSFILYCLLSNKLTKYYIHLLVFLLYFLIDFIYYFLGREMDNYVKIYKDKKDIFEDDVLNKEFQSLISFHSVSKYFGIMIEYSSFINIIIICLIIFKYNKQ